MPKNALLATSCRYGAFEADTCMFVHQKCNLYAVSKTFNGEPEKAEVTVSFDSELERNTKSIEFDITDNTAVIDLEVTAYDKYRTRIALTANKRTKITRKNNALTFRGKCTGMERLGANITNPFFTACGVLSSALCEMLLQSDGENIYLLPAYPAENRNVSFRLAAKGGASVEAEIKNGELKKLKITAKSGKRNFNVYFHGKLIDAKNFRR